MARFSWITRYACGCGVYESCEYPALGKEGEATSIFYCPEHAAAPDMHEALKKIAQCEKHFDGDVVDIARKCLAKAEGRIENEA